MCGTFGFVSFNGKGPSIKRLEAIARVTQRRGPHAFGFAWVDSKGRIKSFKATGKISDQLGLLSLAHDAQFLIGHCRYATHGAPENNLNNHPHPVDGGWFVHNGIISDHREIVKDHNLHPVTDCDSETLGLLIESGEGHLKTRCIEAVQYASGSPLVFLGLWSRPGRLIALRSGNPLSLGICKGRVYIASLQEQLPGKVVQVPNNQGIDFTASGMKTIKFSRNDSGCSGPADDADDAAEQDPLEWDLDDLPVETDPTDDGRGIPKPIVRKAAPGLVAIPGTAGTPKQPRKPAAPKLKGGGRTIWDDELKKFVPRPKQLDGGTARARNWLWDDVDA
jgi:hypothetical protein